MTETPPVPNNEVIPREPQRQREPRGLTVADLLVAVLGSAIMLSLQPFRFPIGFAYPVALPVWFLIALIAVNFVLVLDFVTALVVLLRRFEYGGMPRPAEWLAILLGMWLLSMAPPNVDDLINSILQWTDHSDSFWAWRWTIAGIGFLGCVICVAASWRFRHRLPQWTNTFLLATVALVLLWAPLWVVEQQLPDLFPRWPGKDAGWAFWFYFETCRGFAKLPRGLLFGVPAVAMVAAWKEHHTRGWVWTDWIGLITATLLMLAGLLWFYVGSYETPPTGWIAERIVTTVGFVVVYVLSRLIVTRCSLA